MLFALICIDNPDSSELRSVMRASHLAYIDAQLRQVKIAGPFMSDDDQTMLGSLIVIEALDIAAARAFAAADPYALGGLFSTVDIKPWRWTVGAPKGG
ncbi:MAG: YciI family protein [Alphaproteobacteria bacterium]|nr:YciI family protein [Alphaproteobacteria bacterium]